MSWSKTASMKEMAERLLEAIQWGLWAEPGAYREQLEDLLLDTEDGLERG